VTDWYIKDFNSQIVVNKNSTLDITEVITADCGNVVGKHGIFRILPTSVTIGTTKISTPVEPISITDQNGRALQYTVTQDANTVTWKIGDPNATVQGVNIYKIHYLVKNVIRFGNPQFDELYWNLNGNYWDLQTDHFTASIIFPQEINSQNTTVDYYAGSLGSKNKNLATYHWSASNVLEFESTGMLDVRQGITASVLIPKNIFTPYQPNFWELYGQYAYLLIPLAVLLICLILWWKYGKDPKVNEAIIPEYEAPGQLSPIELGMLTKSGKLENSFITAEIINFATKGLLTITETHSKVLFFDSKDYELQKKENPPAEQGLNAVQKEILDNIFSDGTSTRKLSDLKNSFYKHLPAVKKAGETLLKDKGLIMTTGLHISLAFKTIGLVSVWLAIFSFTDNGLGILAASIIISGAIIFVFSFIMPKRTSAGAKLNREIAGFKMFMETVDKDRAAFYEKENIFEKFLPYAIVFDMTDLWIQRMKEIYGDNFYSSYAPAWYVGNVGSFDVNSLSNTISGLSDSIAAGTSAPSGSGGMGGAGGGGGGGGGGGW